MINIENLSKTYNKHRRNENTVLKETSLQLPNEGFIFFVGRSGTGKSTMLNAIGGLISYEGKILFDKKEVDIEQYRRRNIGYIFQNFLIFEELSVYDNIRVALNLIGIYDEEEIHARTKALLEAVDLDINPSRRAGALSLGQRQRVAIARSLASNPKIILADEPTGNLDSKNSIIVMNILKKLSKNHLVICVTHNLGLVNKYADKTFMIENKKVIGFDKSSSKVISSSNITQNINVANMEVDEYKDENFLIKLYTQSADKNDENNEIKIIRQNGKILVVGNNISIASNDEVTLETTEKSNQQQIDHLKDINLNFEQRKDKKTIKDTSMYKVLRKKLTTKPTFKSTLNTLSTIVFPFILLIMFNLLIGQINSLKDTNIFPLHENAVFVLNEDSDDLSYNAEDYIDLLYDEDSGIVDYLSYYPQSQTSRYAVNTELSLPISSFNFTNSIISDIDFQYSSDVEYIVRDFADYRTFDFGSSFADELEDNQAYITTAVRDQIKSIVGDAVYTGGMTIDEALVNSNIYINYYNYDGIDYQDDLTIIGVVDSTLPAVFVNENTSARLNLMEKISNYGYRYMLSRFLSEFSFVEYDDIKDDSNYRFFNSNTGFEETPDEKTFETNTSYAYFSAEMLDSLFYQSILNIEYDSDYFIENINDPESKIICFRDYSTTDGTFNDSSSLFINSYVDVIINSSYMQLPTSEITITEGRMPTEIYEIALPESYRDFGNISEDTSGYIVTGYYDDSGMEEVNVIASNKFLTYINMPDFAVNYSTNLGDLIDGNTSNVLITSDYEKTKSYFENHPELKKSVYTYDSIYKLYSTNSEYDNIVGSATSIAVIGGIFLSIVILSNFSYINKEKYRFGVLRCLGYSKKELVAENTSLILSESLLNAIIPCLLFTILLLAFGVYNLGWLWTIVFYLAHISIMIATSNIPLWILLRKKPVDIIGSLN